MIFYHFYSLCVMKNINKSYNTVERIIFSLLCFILPPYESCDTCEIGWLY